MEQERLDDRGDRVLVSGIQGRVGPGQLDLLGLVKGQLLAGQFLGRGSFGPATRTWRLPRGSMTQAFVFA
jgi:hypothetical protein